MSTSGRRLYVLLALSITTAGLVGAAESEAAELPPGGTFVDDDGNPHEGNIEAIAAAGITLGCDPVRPTLYCPAAAVTRAEMAALLLRGSSRDTDLPLYGGRFSDVHVSDWYAGYVERAAQLGIVTGYPDGTFHPLAAVSRAEMAVLLLRTIGDQAGVPEVAEGFFADVPVTAWYAPWAERLFRQGITRGCASSPLRYCPDASVRRDEMASFLARTFGLQALFPPPRTSCDPTLPEGCRTTTDLADEVGTPQLHVAYVLPSDGIDRRLDVDGTIERSVGQFQAWLAAQTGGRALRLDTFGGKLEITFHRLGIPDAVLAPMGDGAAGRLEVELGNAGLITRGDGKYWAVYYDGGNQLSCGGAEYFGPVAAEFLLGDPAGSFNCADFALGPSNGPHYKEFGMLHEILHALGFTSSCSPNFVAGAHVDDSRHDLMYGQGDWAIPDITLDVGRDDYYGHSIPACPDLEDHPIFVQYP